MQPPIKQIVILFNMMWKINVHHFTFNMCNFSTCYKYVIKLA
jgi:hypothetical protein